MKSTSNTYKSLIYKSHRDLHPGEIEIGLSAIWAKLLSLPVDDISARANFFELGGHSLLSIRMVAEVRACLAVELTIREIFDHPKLTDIACKINESRAILRPQLVAVEREGNELLPSYAQQRLWFIDQMDGSSSHYNMPGAVEVKGDFNVLIAEQVFIQIIQRHETLRSVFNESDGGSLQIIREQFNFTIRQVDLSRFDGKIQVQEIDHLIRQDAARPFNLKEDLMLRVSFLYLGEKKGLKQGVMLINMHHIASDGWSVGNLLDEFEQLYCALLAGKTNPLPPLAIQYADYTEWQRNWLSSEVLSHQLSYWKRQLDGLPQVHNLPLDGKRPQFQTFNGAIFRFEADKSVLNGLKELALEQQATLFMVLHATFAWLLSCYSNSRDIVIGTPVANRLQKELEPLIGFFVNTLVLRTDCSNNPSFIEFLQQIRNVNLDAQANQEVPFEHLVDQLKPVRNTSYNALFQITLMMGGYEIPPITIEDLEFKQRPNEHLPTKFELTLDATDETERLAFIFDYNRDLFNETTIMRLSNSLLILLKGIVECPRVRLSELPLLSEEERNYLLYKLNDALADYPKDQCIHKLFEQQVTQTPNNIAVVFEQVQLSYAELNQHANQLAHYLIEQGVTSSDFVGLCFERSQEMIVAIMAVLKSGAAYVPLDPSYPRERLDYIVKDNGMRLILSQYHLKAVIQCEHARLVMIDDTSVQANLTDYALDNPIIERLTSCHLVYVIYTSGSTGQPKGVMVEHKNLSNYVFSVRHYFDDIDGTVFVTNYCFDGTLASLFPPLINGQYIKIIAEDDEKFESLALEIIDSDKRNLFKLTPSLLDATRYLSTKNSTNAQHIFLIGGEPLSIETYHFWSKLLPNAKFINQYGPTETTIGCATYCINREKGFSEFLNGIPIGTALNNNQFYILEQNQNLVPIGTIGELHISGAGLARGYLNRPELTAERFCQNPFSDDPSDRLYKTGDLMRYLPDGNLEFIGRIDDQVKIRGFRIELGEIEYQLSQLPEVKSSVVLAREDESGEKRLVAYVTTDATINSHMSESDLTGNLREDLQSILPDYMVPSFFVVLDELPLTSNGKIDKKALPAPNGSILVGEYVAPTTDTEIQLVQIWSNLLKLDSDKLSTTANFFELGGHSLLSIRLVAEVRTHLSVELGIRDIFEVSQLSRLASLIDKSGEKTVRPQVEAVERLSNQLTPSFAQQRLWFIDQMDGGSIQYNMPGAMRFKGVFTEAIVEQAFNQIIERHEPLRTVFINTDKGARQVIRADFEFKLTCLDLTALASEAQAEAVQKAVEVDANQVFDLSEDIMLRSTFIRLSADEGVLLFNMHHIASDGWSIVILIKEFTGLYEAILTGSPNPFEPLSVQYVDYAQWQRNWLEEEALDRQLIYWDKQLAELPQVHSLPLDRARPKAQSFNGAHLSFAADLPILEGLKQIALSNNATLFMLLHGAFSLLLSRHSNCEDIVVGVPVANRLQKELEPLIGFFVNTLVLKADCSGNPLLKDFLKQIKTVNLDAQANQDVPFEHLVERLNPVRSTSYSPLFQILFTMNTNEGSEFELPGLTLTPLEYASEVAKFELTLGAMETEEGLNFDFVYNSDLFDKKTIERMGKHLIRLLQGIVVNPQCNIAELPMLSEEEQHYLLHILNDTHADHPKNQCIHELFELQVTQTPDNIALVFEGEKLTYSALNEKANRLANYLREVGVRPDTLVGLCVERSLEMVIGLLSIFKAGGAYVPLDPSYPEYRLNYIVEDSEIKLLLTQKYLGEDFGNSSLTTIFLNDDLQQILKNYLPNNPKRANLQSPDNLAYVIYTSGSTGNPKGVMVEHHNVVRLLKATDADFKFCNGDVWTLFHSYAFDFSVWEIWGALARGGRLIVISHWMSRSHENFYQLLIDEKVTVLNQTPISFNLLNEIDAERKGELSLRVIIFGGESLNLSELNSWVDRHGDNTPALVNMYGITETTVHVTYRRILSSDIRDNKGSLIGRPISDLKFYILNEHLAPVPIGTRGEIFVSGTGVARGYLNQQELTNYRFVDNPFMPGERLYRTGDLARYLVDGEIEYLGRIDHQVKIRGFRIELGEIEYQLSQLPAVKSSVVLAREDELEQKQLVAYFVAEEDGSFVENELVGQLREKLASCLPDYMLPSAFVLLDELPLTPNGKVDKKALPAPDRNLLQNEYVAPESELEKRLLKIWAKLLKLDVARLSVTANFFELGGDSILSIQVVSRSAQAGLHFRVKDLFAAQTIRQLAHLVQSGSQTIAPQEAINGQLSLIPIQRKFFDDEVDIHHFNQSVILTTPDGFDVDILQAMVSQLYQRHDGLRLKFVRGGAGWSGEYVPFTPSMVDATVEIKVWADESTSGFEPYATSVQESLNLEEGLLFKAVYIQSPTTGRPGRLLLVIHHLVIDGVSWRVLLEDLETLYTQRQMHQSLSLLAKTSSYQQWGAFLLEYAQSEALLKERDYWLQVFDTPVSPLQKSLANVGDGVSKKGETEKSIGTASFNLSESLTRQLLTQGNQAYRTQINELLLAGLLSGIHQWGGVEAIRIDLEGHGREALNDRLDLSQTLGWFTTVYPLCLSLDNDDSPGSLINAVKEQYRAIPNHGIGFGVLKHLREDDAFKALPSPELVFNYLGQFDQVVNADRYFSSANESTGQSVSLARQMLHALSLNGLVSDGSLGFSLTFDKRQYNETAMQRLMDCIAQSLTDIIEHCVATTRGCYTPCDFPLAKVKREGLNQWLNTTGTKTDSKQEIEIEDLFPATGMQQGLLFHSMLQSSNYVTQALLRFEGLNIAYFQQAWQQVVQRHGIFRTAFRGLESGNAHQLVHAEVELPWRIEDLSGLNEAEQQAQVEAIRVADKAQGFEPSQAPLMRITVLKLSPETSLNGGVYQCLWSHHHALLDGWCLPLVFGEVTECYRALQEGVAPQLDAVQPYRNYAAWLAEQNEENARHFWHEQLSDIEGKTPLPQAVQKSQSTQENELTEEETGVYQETLIFTKEETEQLVQLAQSARTTVNVIVQAAWALLLSRYSGEQRVVFGAVTSGRPAELAGVEQMVGLFINSLPVVVDIDSNTQVVDWLQQLHGQLVERESYSYYPLHEIQKLSSLSQGLFDSLMVFENYPVDEALEEKSAQANLKVKDVQSFEGTNYDISLTAHMAQALSVKIEAQKQSLTESGVTQVSEHIKQLLLSFAQCGESSVAEIEMLSKAEVDYLVNELNDTQVDYPQDKLIHELFEAQVVKTPDNIAVVFEEKQLTYRELNESSNRLAHYLVEQGVTPDSLVGVCLERSLEMMVGILGILKAGAAYLPLEPNYPQVRLDYLIGDSGLLLILSKRHLHDVILNSDLPRVLLDTIEVQNCLEDYPSHDPVIEILTCRNLAYVIYTSGSTGKPKGVMVEHQALANRIDWMQKEYRLSDRDVVLQKTPFSFDVSVWELFWPMTVGAKLIIAKPEGHKDPDYLIEAIQQYSVTILHFVPSMFRFMLANKVWKDCHSLRHVFCSGEALTTDLPPVHYNANSSKLHNLYGPTEAAIDVSYYSTVNDKNITTIPIGKPIQNIQLFVLNEQKQLLPAGVLGELYIGGVGLARGYLNRPELTGERFIANPFDGEHSKRLYRTGDLVRYLADGNLQFIGRVDHQVKVRGFRIELGEIEHQLAKYKGVSSAVVESRKDLAGQECLVAYVVLKDRSGKVESKLVDQLRQSIIKNLPDYMLPSNFVFLDELPLTTNGKIDRKNLQALDGIIINDDYLAPVDDVETTLCRIWAELLELPVDKIGANANFFVLGGHSLLFIQLIEEIRSAFNIKTDIKTLFEASDLRALGDLIKSLQKQVLIAQKLSIANENETEEIEL